MLAGGTETNTRCVPMALEEEERWMREIERKLADGHVLSEEELQLVARFAEEQELEDA